MIICRECGNHNGDADTFCGSCGSFLEWTGERTAPRPAPPPEPEPEPEVRQRPTLLQRIAGVIAPAPGGSPVDEGVLRVGAGAGRAPGTAGPLGARPGLPGLSSLSGPPSSGRPPGPPGLRPPGGAAGPPGTAAGPPGLRPPGTAAGPPGLRPPGTAAGPPGLRPPGTAAGPPGLRPPGTAAGPAGPRSPGPPSGPPGVRPPGSAPAVRPGPPTAPPDTDPADPGAPARAAAGAPPTAPPARRLPPPPPGVTGARLPDRAARPGPPGVRPGPGSDPDPPGATASDREPSAGEPAGEESAAGEPAAGLPRRLPPPPPGIPNASLPDPASRPPAAPSTSRRGVLAAPHTSALVAPDESETATSGPAPTGRPGSRRGPAGAATTEPEEVRPQAARTRVGPAGHRPPTRRLQPGDLICGECGEGNPPTRRFCSRCGDSLRTAEVARRRWWQRLLPRRGPRVRQAGARPGTPGGGAPGGAGGVLHAVYRRANAVAAVLLFAVGIAYLIYPPLRDRVNAAVAGPVTGARDWVDGLLNPRFVAVRPVEVTGDTAVPEQGPDLVVDQYRNTHWQAPWDEQRPPTVTLRFASEVDLERLIVTAGTAEDYTLTHRPATLHLVYSTNRSDTLTIQDTGEPQTLTLGAAEGITTVQIQITGIFRAEKGTDVTVSEFEFFALE
ncbi:NADase-type glycan-binding domain-containing protein [Polymorphospora rubra]|uniref:NADase-type glycan-binding domain-containing protein n=1 Tax=Polymorphospora rubra TaxID=338584 RepID=UPI0033F8F6BA